MPFADLSRASASAIADLAPSLLAVRGTGGGTATVIGPGRAVTAAHLVDGATVRVLDGQGREADARVLGVHPGTDLALLDVAADLPPVPWGDPPAVGQLVLPVARGGHGVACTLGVLARVGSAWSTSGGGQVDARLEVDGSLPAGFSGGPLLGPGGVLGVNTHRLARGGTTLPRATVERVAAELEARGTVQPGFLGIGGARAVLSGAQADVAGQSDGLLVIGVSAGGPADGVLSVGDVVLRVDGHAVRGVHDLRGVLGSLGAGHAARLDVLSGTEVGERTVTLAARPSCD